MQTISQPTCISIHQVNPLEFAAFCNEVHAVIRGNLADYLQDVVRNKEGRLFAAYDSNGDCTGRVEVEINPRFSTRGKPCATFGWLDATDAGTVNLLLGHASDWASKQEVIIGGTRRRNALLRGPVSFPKGLGGLGCQVEGFQMPRMYGVPASRPEMAAWIEAAGFKQDASYACVDVTNTPAWESAGTDFARSFQLVNFSPDGWAARQDEIVGLVAGAFSEIFPDTVGGRFDAIVETMGTHPNGKYYWPAALDMEGKLAGAIVCIPNLWQAWDGQSVTGVNVDTVVINPKYRGKGLFSALHDKGYRDMQTHCGVTYFEGTAIWYANENAVKSIFPHGTLVRKYVVYQKRLKKM